jgi:hypothetical protein
VTSSYYVDENAPDDSILVVRSGEGAVVQREILPRLTVLDPPVAVTASGKVLVAGSRRGSLAAGERYRNVWRLEGKTWKNVEVTWTEGDIVLSAYGETVVAHTPSAEDAVSGALLQILDGSAPRAVRLPAHGIGRLQAVDGGVFGVRSVSEATSAGFPESVHSIFSAKLTP